MRCKLLAATAMATGALLVTDCQHINTLASSAHYHDAPAGFYGGMDFSGSNVVLGWNHPPGPVKGYQVIRREWNTNSGNYHFVRFSLSPDSTFFVDSNAMYHTQACIDAYLLRAEYRGGTLSVTDTWYFGWHDQFDREGPPFGPPKVAGILAMVDPTGTNVIVSWPPVDGPATNYIIVRAAYNPTNTDGYDFNLIGTVNSNVTCFTAQGVVQSTNDLSDIYEVAAIYPGNAMSAFVAAQVDPNLAIPIPPAIPDR